LPEEATAALGGQYHVQKDMLLETAKEPVTFGRVGIVLTWLCACTAEVERVSGSLLFESGRRLPEFPPLGSGGFLI
jgi:hypothetical protein